jgi:hypothetical protein
MSILNIWPQQNHDLQGTSRTDDASIEGSILAGLTKWDHRLLTSPVNYGPETSLISYYDNVSNESKIFVGTTGGIYKFTCNELTKTLTSNGLIYSRSSILPFIRNNGYLYVPESSSIKKIDESGTIIQSYSYPLYSLNTGGATEYCSPTIGPDGNLYMFGSFNSGLSGVTALEKFNESTGNPIWIDVFNSPYASSPYYGSCVVFDSSDSDVLYLLSYNRYYDAPYAVYREVSYISQIRASDGHVYNQESSASGDFYGAIFYKDGSTKRLYVSSGSGLYIYDEVCDYITKHVSAGCKSAPSQGSDGTIYYRAGVHLYAINPDGSQKWDFSSLPGAPLTPPVTAQYASPIIDKEGYIIICNDTQNSDVTIIKDYGTYGGFITSITLPFAGDTILTPTIGAYNVTGGALSIATKSNDILYAYGAATAPTTTTTTTTPSPTTTTTTSTGTGTTTTTTTLIPPTTTTTTTTRPPLAIVETSQFELVNGQFVSVQTSNASDSSTTQNSLLSQALTFGTIAPNETSKTIIVALNIPYAKAITNIKIGLVSSGGIAFANNIFGITSSVELRDDITPDSYFQGVNANKVSTDSYNINIRNKDNHTSEYVYLNVKLPNNQIIGEGMIKWKWFFDYSE